MWLASCALVVVACGGPGSTATGTGGGGAGGTSGDGGAGGRGGAGAAGTAGVAGVAGSMGVAGAGGAAGTAGAGGAGGTAVAGFGGAAGSTGLAGAGGAAGSGTSQPTLYLAIQQNTSGGTTLPNELIRIDVTSGAAVADVSLNGISAIAQRAGTLLVARAYGYTRVPVLDPNTLAVLRTLLVPWDLDRAVFTADGRFMYAGHGDGYVSRVRMADGAVTGTVQIPPTFASNAVGTIEGLALDPSETSLAATTFGADAIGQVAMVRITGDSLALERYWVPPMFSESSCLREPGTPAFGRAGTSFATFDRNCAVFEVYDATNGSPKITATMFVRPDGARGFSSMIVDALDQFWTANYDSVYRMGADRTQQSMYSIGGLGGMFAATADGQTIYFIADDPRRNGIFTVDPTTGTGTRLAWNLDLIPLGAFIVVASMAD